MARSRVNVKWKYMQISNILGLFALFFPKTVIRVMRDGRTKIVLVLYLFSKIAIDREWNIKISSYVLHGVSLRFELCIKPLVLRRGIVNHTACLRVLFLNRCQNRQPDFFHLCDSVSGCKSEFSPIGRIYCDYRSAKVTKTQNTTPLDSPKSRFGVYPLYVPTFLLFITLYTNVDTLI